MAAKRISDLEHVGTLESSAVFILDTQTGTFKCSLLDISDKLQLLASPHVHGVADITGLSTALSGKSDNGHAHIISNITGLDTALSGKADSSHAHALSAITGFPAYAAQTGVLTATDGVLSWAEVSGGNAVGDVAATPNTVAQRDASADIYAHNFVSSSDIALKKNVVNVENGLELVQSLQGRYFDWIANDVHNIGFIAQEVEEVLPIAVLIDYHGVKSVNYLAIIPLLVEAVKTLSARLDALDNSKGE